MYEPNQLREGVTMINMIPIPKRFVDTCEGWYGDVGDPIYAVYSTKGLTTGTRCPIVDYDDYNDKMRKWYLHIWRDLVCALERAKLTAVTMVRKDDRDDYAGEAEKLGEFEEWARAVVESLEKEYGLADCEG
ncbi:MAG: hypothetical protein ACW99J_19170 [Candidatus Thorarchaeota archaeon]|jgi:hypothetical protein